ncbi:hypothetical protein EDC96DRAFT_514161 [Choanephora cucurbitarum]|nr:hypothetical protein EDC96DRAFT_514161 [Choanephora cucurbitarum]
MSEDHTSPTADPYTADSSFESEFGSLCSAIQAGSYDKAIQSFVLLHSNSLQNPTFQSYLIQLAENIDPSKDTESSRFFATLPCLLQSNIIDFATERLEEKESMRAFGILFDYIQAYPRHAYKYLINAINLLILCAQALKGDERQKCISLLVTELFPRLCKQRLLLVRKDKMPSITSTESKHYITLPYNLFEQFLLLGQRFYIKKYKWEEVTKFTCNMLSACGYNGFEQLDTMSHIDRFQYLIDHRLSIRVDDEDTQAKEVPVEDFSIITTLMCEYMATASQFVQYGYEYYKYVCGTNEAASSRSEEKSCLIPVCSFQPNSPQDQRPLKRTYNEEQTTLVDYPNSLEKRLRTEQSDHRSEEEKEQEGEKEDEEEEDEDEERKEEKLAESMYDERGQGLDSYCIRGVDDALQILSKAADCLRHVVELWQWASSTITQKSLLDQLIGWEQEFCRIIDGYRLPFDMHNAVLLVRSDLALSSPSVPGNLAKALELSQTICDRIEAQRRQEKTDYGRSSSEMDIPFMFAFRVLYNIGVIYLLVGSLQQSTLEIAIILSVFPIPNGLDEKDFVLDESDCYTVANVFYGREFGLMRVTQEGLVVRCIKHLIVSLDNESEQRGGMASIDSALRWDEKAGNMIVLMQYGWPYWKNKTNLWEKIIHRISEKRIFKNREFLEYLYISDVLQAIRHLHLMGTVAMDIIPPEFALRNSYRHLVTPGNETPPPVQQAQKQSEDTQETPASSIEKEDQAKAKNRDVEEDENADMEEEDEDEDEKPEQECRGNTLPLYHPSFANSILPSTSMSPSWYSASTQKNSFAKWMSPSFYYSRPATSVILPTNQQSSSEASTSQHPFASPASAVAMMPAYNAMTGQHPSSVTTFIPRDIVTRCLEYRIRRYSPKITPQRMRHVLQRFLKNMVLKANEEA